MDLLEALEGLERKFGKKAPTLRRWLENREKVDLSLAIATLRREIGVKIVPYGSVVLGVPNPKDIDGYVHPGDRDVVERVKAILGSLTGLVPSLGPLERGSIIPNTVAGKIERLALKDGKTRSYGPSRFSKLLRDAEHLRYIAMRASESELLVYLYAVELIDHLKKKGLTNEQILKKLQHYARSSGRIDRIKGKYSDVFAFLERVINTAKKLLTVST